MRAEALHRDGCLPDEALTANDEARDRIVKPIIIEHWGENGGRVPAFGGITGYVLVLVAGYGGFDFGLPFSITGDRSGATVRALSVPSSLIVAARQP